MSKKPTTATPSIAELQAMPVHPLAAMFPMLPDDEIADLAADIAANGLNHPIVISADGVLIDGRNRLAACAVAKAAPTVTIFPGDDPAAFIISENINRRHLSKSQRAMAVAKAYPEPAKGGRGKNSKVALEFSAQMVSQARTILRLSPDLVDLVLAGTMTVDDAYKKASLRKSEAERLSDRVRSVSRENPELAEAVSAGAMTVEEAEQKIVQAKREREQQRWAATENLLDGVLSLDRPVEKAAEYVELYDPLVADKKGRVFNVEKVRKAAAFLTAFADAWEGAQSNG